MKANTKTIYDADLGDKNIIEHIFATQDMVEQHRKYFGHNSQFFKCLQNYVEKSVTRKDCVFFKEKDLEIITDSYDRIKYCRGHGPAIHFRKVEIFGKLAGNEKGDFCLTVEIIFESEYSEREHREVIRIDNIPADLELNFTKQKFATWIRQLKEERKKTKLAKLERLIKKFPKEAEEILSSTK